MHPEVIFIGKGQKGGLGRGAGAELDCGTVVDQPGDQPADVFGRFGFGASANGDQGLVMFNDMVHIVDM